jgi:hypothetical protein
MLWPVARGGGQLAVRNGLSLTALLSTFSAFLFSFGVSAGEVVHVISRSREAMRILKRRGAVAIHHNEATAQ